MGFFEKLFKRKPKETKQVFEDFEEVDLIDITRKQYLQALERNWDYKIGSLKAKYKSELENQDQERKDAERDKLEKAGASQEDIGYIIGLQEAEEQKQEDEKLGRVLKDLPENA